MSTRRFSTLACSSLQSLSGPPDGPYSRAYGIAHQEQAQHSSNAPGVDVNDGFIGDPKRGGVKDIDQGNG